MALKLKICGVSNVRTLEYLVNHKRPPEFIGFIVNYPKSKRYVNKEKLNKLFKIKKKSCLYVAVLVNPEKKILEEIKNLPFDYYQLYDCNFEETNAIKKKYDKKIITAITVEDADDVNKYKLYENVADMYLFDSKGYEKSKSFNHSYIENINSKKEVMLAGDIHLNDNLEKYKKIADIIDISGGLETFGLKDISKIDIFLKKMQNLDNET